MAKGLWRQLATLGFQGDRPSHPELLDWLARDFVDQGWDLKRWQRQIVMSRAYRQTSQKNDVLWKLDPDNRLLGRMPLRRLDSEAMRDAVLATSGQLSGKRFGVPVPVAPDEVGQFHFSQRQSRFRPVGHRVSKVTWVKSAASNDLRASSSLDAAKYIGAV